MMYRIFGDAPTIRILDWMIENQEYDHSMKEIAGGTKLSMIVVKRNFEPLLKHEVVKVNRVVGRDGMYVLDLQNRCTKAIIEFDRQIAKCCDVVTENIDDPEESEEFIEMDEAHEQLMAGPPEY